VHRCPLRNIARQCTPGAATFDPVHYVAERRTNRFCVVPSCAIPAPETSNRLELFTTDVARIDLSVHDRISLNKDSIFESKALNMFLEAGCVASGIASYT
jgi:hypothetical protein